jgi:uncharacterized protein YpbB
MEETEFACEECGSKEYLQIIKDGVVIEIVKHYSDCPIIIHIQKRTRLFNELYKNLEKMDDDVNGKNKNIKGNTF